MATAEKKELTELVRVRGGGELVPRSSPPRAAAALMDLQDVYYLAQQVAASGLFPNCDNVSQAFALMMLCQSENLHPMMAIRRYDIIEGRPALKAAAVHAEFLARGGRVELLHLDDERATARFAHPRLLPEPVERTVTFQQFESTYARGKDGQLKKNWKNSRSDMLWARLVSFCRKIDPGIATGIPVGEEAADRADDDRPGPAGPALPSPDRPRSVEPPVWGQREEGVDGRPYHALAAAAAEALADRFAADGLGPCPLGAREVHAHLIHRAVQQGLCDPPKDRKSLTVLTALAVVYGRHRDWLRGALNELLDSALEAARAARGAADPAAAAGPDSAPDPDDYNGGEPGGRVREPGED